MNIQEDAPRINDDTSVYDLVTELSRHTLQTYRSYRRNIQFTRDQDVKTIKHLRTKAFEILLKKPGYMDFKETDPLLEIDKHVFVLKLGLRHASNATTLENLLHELEEISYSEISVFSVLQLLVQLKNFSINPEPITNIFYYGKTNPAIPEITHTTNKVSPFQVYPMECFISTDKFEATLKTQRFQITHAIPTSITNEVHFLCDPIKSKGITGIESTDISTAYGFMSNHAFDAVSSHALLSSNQRFAINSGFNSHILQETMFNTGKNEIVQIFPWEQGFLTNYLCLPFMQEVTGENENYMDTWRHFEHSDIDESNNTEDIWNLVWNQIDVDDASTLDYQTWEYFGEVQSIKESAFITDTPAAAIHLTKIKQMNNFFPLLSEKIINSVLLLEEISAKEFINDLKSMLLGIESNSFEYRCVTGFILRKNISVYGICSESLGQACQEAVKWGNCFKFLSRLVTPRLQSDKLQQEGLIFKAMCTNIKELLLYYQAALLRIFTYENESQKLLNLFHKVRSVATLITKVAKVCEPYKENKYMLREGSGILTRIYNEAIKVTDSKVALVFYSLLKSCCEVYFRFLQKWIFEGICEDIYGEFMIITRPQYLRNRGHQFWTKSFSICNDAVPGFLRDLAESILQCGKTVRLLRTCDSKNPVCHVCVTEQPEVKVCLSVSTLNEQSLRCREYEKKGASVLGPILSLSTAILNEKLLKKEMSEIAVRGAQNDSSSRIHGEREATLKVLDKHDFPTNLLGRVSLDDLQRTDKKENTISNKIVLYNERDKQENIVKENYVERTNILNYYENLTNHIDQRCIRSQWRAKRMTFDDKRIDALISAKQDLHNQLNVIEEARIYRRSMIRSNSVTGTPVSFEDENKNYARASYRKFMSDAITKPYIETRQEDLRQSSCSFTSYIHETKINDNENNDFHDFERPEGLNTKTFLKFSPKSLTNKISCDTSKNPSIYHCTDQSSAIERPTFLNVIKTDNVTESQVTKMCTRPLKCNMTPNNNEPIIQQIKITPSSNESMKQTLCYVENASLSQENDLETPMSWTADNCASSLHSPVSQMYNLEDLSSMEISTPIVSNSSRTITKSPAVIKEDLTFSDLFVLARNETSITSPVTAPLTIADVEIIDHTSLQAYLERSICIPLDIQSRLVNNAIIKYFLKENRLLLHLHSLRSYFFLLNGEFAKSLTGSLYARLYQISLPIELFNSATLTNLLERALVNSFNNVYVNSELLSLSATDTPVQLHISDPTALDCLSLNYKINWPLNIILDETVMQQYGRVFKFLITSGRVSWVLQEDFNIMKRERRAGTSEEYHKLQLYRHSMTQFMNALHNYLTCSVLYASWAEFEKDLENSLTVDQIYLSHVNYIKRILSRCMLNSRGEKVRVCLNNIFKVILKFHNRLRSQNWIMKSSGYVHPNFKKLEQMYRAFCELRTYMAHVAFKLATSGYQPHLMHFLNALNINQVYDLTVKTYRGSTGLSEL